MQFQKKRCVAMLLAGGQGSRLMVLTENTAKPAVPFGGKYRIIDFPLSNCVNSKIDTVGILTQYQPLELNEYIGNGQPWGLNSSHGGVLIALIAGFAISSIATNHCGLIIGSTVVLHLSWVPTACVISSIPQR